MNCYLLTVASCFFLMGVSASQRVGCDGVLGSGLVLDKCGVCGGSNTDCEITREYFDKNDLSVGYHIIATVPEGAMYINMTELRRSRNYLAVESADGKPYINGAWHIDYPGNFTVAGTVFQYKRSTRTDEGEQILAMGPTNEVVHLMMIYQQANPGVYYEYTIPLHKPSDVRGVGGDLVNEQDYDYSSYSDYEAGVVPGNRYTGSFTAHLPGSSNPKGPSGGTYPYKYPSFGQGNPPSGGRVPIYEAVDTPGHIGGRYPPYGNPGYQPHSRPPADTPYDPRQQGGSSLSGQYPPRVVEPPRQSDPAQYPNRGLNDELKQGEVGTFDPPSESSSSDEIVDGTEDTNNMMYYWMETQMTECSRSCAGGIQQSMSQCVEFTTAAPVDDSMCVLDWKPATKTMACNTQPCPPTWTIGEWTECSASCGQSRRIRQVLCKEQRTISVITTVPLENCNQTSRPTSMEACDVPSCAAWQVGDWGECSADCGIGEKQRRVYCEADGAEVLERNCAGQEKPDPRQECDMGSCVPEWLYSSYAESCSVGCGTGYKTRNVICSTAGVAGAVSQENCEGMKKPKATKVCNRGSCGAKWVMSEWSQCTSECGPGTQSRTVVCLSSRNYPRIVSDSDCRGEKPAENQECLVRECGSMWYTSDYSQCSRSCGGGTMTRTVKCLNEAFEPSTDCPDEDKPSSAESCNPHECVDNAPPTNCRDKFSYCNKVARSRLCSYSYYSRLCCFSCYNQINKR